MKRTLARVVKVVLVLVIAAGASARLLQAQLPQSVGTWLSRGAVADARIGAASVALDDGRTLVAGGRLADGSITDGVAVYDPVANATTVAGHLFAPRVNASATLLADGRLLITGGLVGGAPSADVEIFDLAAGTSAFAATMAGPRAWHASARLFDDTVLIVGGATTNGAALSSAEIFDPETSSIYPAGEMTTPRVGASATATIDHRVLIAGGFNGMQDLATAEIYDAYLSAFTMVPTQMAAARSGHTAVLLPHNGGVLLAGGTSAGTIVATTDVFVPAVFPDPYSWGMGSFAPTGALTAPRAFATGGPLGDNGFAYVAGGGSADAEAYRFATIKTDKDDYPPGEPAIITGSGWQPGEAVTLTFQEDPAVHDDYSFAVTADALGNIYWDQWAPEEHDYGVRFYLTAQGSMSRAQTTFTDGGFILRASVGHTFTSSHLIYPGTTNSCGTVLAPIGTIGPISAAVSATSGPIVAMNNNQYGKFIVPVVSNEGATYSSVTTSNPGATIISNTLNAAGTHREICFQSTNGSASNLATLTVAYTTTTATPTTTVSPATATYGDASVILSASITSSSTVNVGTVTFTLKQGAITIGSATSSGTVSGGGASVTYPLPAGTGAGLYTIEAAYSGGAGFNASAGTGALSISQKAVTVSTQPASKTYGGADPSPLTTADLSGFLAADVITATFARAAGETVGPYAITTTLVDPNGRLGNYTITNAGATFTINARPVTVTTQPASKIYGEDDPSPLTSAELNVFLAADSISATFARATGDTVGTYAITTTLVDPNGRLGNYTITNAGATFTINARPVTVITQPASKIYGEDDPSPLTSAELNVFLAADSISATFARATGDTVGTYAITTTLVDPNGRLGNYTITNAGATFTINAKPVTVITQPASKIYGEDDPSPLTSVDLSVFLAADGISATLARATGDTVGTYAITTTLVDPNGRLGNYTVTNAGATFTINARPVTVITQPASKTYGDADPSPLTAVDLGDFLPADGITATLSRAPGDDVVAAGYAITTTLVDPSGRLGNYTITNAGATFTINAKPVTVITQPASKIYGEDDPSPLTSVDLSGFLAADGISATLARATGDTVGTYAITTTLVDLNGRLGNYTITNAGATFTINQRTLIVTATGVNRLYDGTVNATVTLLHNALAGDDVTAGYGGATFENRNVGNGKPIEVTGISISGDDSANYTLNGVTTATTSANITARPLSISAVTDSRVYNGTVSSTGVPMVGTLYSPDSVTGLVQRFDTKDVGTGKTLSVFAYVVNDGNGGNNYAVTTVPNNTGVITQRELTVTGITANNKPFDGNTTATLNLGGATLVGVLGSDNVTLNTAGAVGTFSSALVGGPYAVSITGLTITGTGAANYSLTQPSTTASITAWALNGFLQPVGIPNTYPGAPAPTDTTIWNTIKGGQAVPLKFRLFTSVGGTELTSVSSVQGFALATMPCTGGAEDPVDGFPTTGNTELRYSDGQFIQNWASAKGANKCYRVTMTAADGSQLSAFFKTK